ncbi:toll-like receptor 13 [Protopterus annectens]|uniref:toll-like receptor 13 n=1 Tax=Protopterus annectens TaxID=7888 RepID=UPI001CFC32F1|nr:toll-like receptor 13 [Protopterus annectens]
MHSLEVLEVDASVVTLACDIFPFSQIEELYIWNNNLFICFTGVPALEYFTNLRLLHYSSSQNEIHVESQLNSTIPYLHSLENLYLQDIHRYVQRSVINAEVLFYGLYKLQTLHLKNSGITHFTVNMFKDLRSLHGLLVEKQTIIVLEHGIFNSLEKLEYIYFYDVDFKCNCEMFWIIEWLATNIHVQVFDFSVQTCSTEAITFNFLDYLDTQCPPVLEFTLFMLTFCITLSFILFALLHESIWWNLLYLYYLVRERLNNRISRRHGDKYQYDAFVSYSSYDEEWVVNQLLPNLEQSGPPFITLCLHNRDFELGKDIVDNIMDSIQKSRWTICIVTRNYLRSQWCSMEMKMTTYRLIAESRDCLLLILLEKISLEEISYYHRLARLMNKKTYLDWPLEKKDQQLLWEKLKYTILTPTENYLNEFL